MWFVYVIKSCKYNKYYIGYTSDLVKRMASHNQGKTKSIKAFIPYELVYLEKYVTKAEAFRRERQIKKYKGGRAFKKLIGK
jgi:putative endonuclease